MDSRTVCQLAGISICVYIVKASTSKQVVQVVATEGRVHVAPGQNQASVGSRKKKASTFILLAEAFRICFLDSVRSGSCDFLLRVTNSQSGICEECEVF